MIKETLSVKLLKTLSKGKKQLEEEALLHIRDFVESQRTPNDTFVNKNGQEDLYYTLFGWILSYVLGIKLNKVKTATYLSSIDADSLDLIHYAAYIRCRRIQQLAAKGRAGYFLSTLFTEDVKPLSAFSRHPNDDPQSPYSQFIALSMLEDNGQTVHEKDHILQSIQAYHVSSGGYANIKSGRTATTNATVATLSVIGQLAGYKANQDVRYLQSLQDISGGFSATQESPVPDILSTATSLFVLHCYALPSLHPVKDFIEAHWLDSGGFAATLLEESSDVEYTFYGLLALGAS